MIPIMTLDLSTTFATFGWAAAGFVIAALGVILVAVIRDGAAQPDADARKARTPDEFRPAA